MSNVITPTRAAFEDEIALVGYESAEEPLSIGDEIPVVDPRTGGTWQGVVIDTDPELRCIYVRVDTDTFVPPVAFFEETGLEAQRDVFTLEEASDMTDIDFFESKSTGKLYTLREIQRMIDARENFPFFD